MLVGREKELAELDRLLTEAGLGSARAAFVAGEPGIGKTSLLAELVRRAEAAGALALEGAAAQFETELPFGVVADVLDDYLRSRGRTVVERLAADGLSELAEVFPSLRALRASDDAQPPAAAERFRTYFAVRELLERLAARQPLVLVLDDLHWADGASLELVAHLLRRPPDAPVLLVGAFRPAQMAPALAAALDRARGVVVRVDLGPLDAGDAGRLLAGAGAGADADVNADPARQQSLYRQSGGNPFYLLQLARSAGTDGDVPPTVAAAIAAELAAVSPGARAFAEAAAVAGDPFELDVAAAAAAMDEGAALAAVDELVGRDVLRPATVPRRFGFRHPLVRSAVYDGAPAGVRLAAHARCAQALRRRGAPVTARAHHVERSAATGDAEAVATLMEAGRANAGRLPSSAAHWFAAAVRLLGDGGPPDGRVEALVAQGEALTAAGRLGEARSALQEALPLLPPGAGERRLQLTAACAGVEQQLGLLPESHGRLVAALDELGERASPPGVALLVALAADAFYGGRYGELVEWGEAAVAAAAEVGDPELTLDPEAVLAMGLSLTGQVGAAQEHTAKAAAVVDGLADEALGAHMGALSHLVTAEIVLERLADTARHARRGIALGRAAGKAEGLPGLYPCLGTACWALGRLGEAAETLDTAVEAARLTGNVQDAAWGILSRAIAALMAGDWDLARRGAEESTDLAADLTAGYVTAHAGAIAGWVLCETGEPATGVARILAAAGGPDLPLVAWKAGLQEVLTRAWLAQGRRDEAGAAAERARTLAGQLGLPRTTALAHLAAAAVALSDGDAAHAGDEARAAVGVAEGASAALDAATARVVLGRALAQAGDTEAAVAELQAAATAFEAFGAPRRRERVEQELRALGHRFRRPTAVTAAGAAAGAGGGGGLASLSGRELEVARLVVDRRTNPEIAAELFLSLKTVETHLRNVFRKLDVSSRVQVARMLERAGAGR